MKFLNPLLSAGIPAIAAVSAICFCSFKTEENTAIEKTPAPKITPRQHLELQQLGQAKQALAIINKWRGENPQKGKRSLKIVYWSPADRTPQPQHKQRLNEILKDIQTYYTKEMERSGFGKLSLKFDKDKTGAIEIIEAKGQHPYKHYAVNSGGEVLKDATAELKKRGIDAKKETVVIFCNMSNWDSTTKRISQNSPYYARGNAREGVAWQVDSAILNLADLTNMKDRVRDGQYGNITRGKYNTIFIGGVAHELGHAFGLPHNLERKDEKVFGIALMGAGNRAYGNERRKDGKPAFLTLASSLKLATHPMFSGVTKDYLSPVQYSYEALQYAVSKDKLIIKGKIKSSIPAYAVVAFVDPDGGRDYDANTQVSIPDKDGNFTITCSVDCFNRKKGKGTLQLVSYFVNGDATSYQSPHRRGQVPYTYNKEKGIMLGTAKK